MTLEKFAKLPLIISYTFLHLAPVSEAKSLTGLFLRVVTICYPRSFEASIKVIKLFKFKSEWLEWFYCMSLTEATEAILRLADSQSLYRQYYSFAITEDLIKNNY